MQDPRLAPQRFLGTSQFVGALFGSSTPLGHTFFQSFVERFQLFLRLLDGSHFAFLHCSHGQNGEQQGQTQNDD